MNHCLSLHGALHERFVICPIDKAASNLAFVFKRFYASILLKELDLYSINSNDDPTYISISETLFDEIIINQKKDLGKFGITATDESEGLPSMYWTPKKHKVPSKARFIVAAKKMHH